MTTWPVNSLLIDVFEANLFYRTNGGYFNVREGILLKDGVANVGTSRWILNS